MTTPIRVGGRKPPAETLRERLAFNDPDRTTPVHDDICLWLDGWLREEANLWVLCHGGYKSWNPEYLKAITAPIRACRKRVLDDTGRMDPRSRAQWEEWSPPTVPEYEAPELIDVTWELAVGDEKWVSGFIDVNASIRRVTGLLTSDHSTHDSSWACTPPQSIQLRSRTTEYAFEIKSAIPSLGELIRQIRYYERKHTATYYVVAPDDRHVATLNAQGIGFIHYPSGTVSRP